MGSYIDMIARMYEDVEIRCGIEFAEFAHRIEDAAEKEERDSPSFGLIGGKEEGESP